MPNQRLYHQQLCYKLYATRNAGSMCDVIIKTIDKDFKGLGNSLIDWLITINCGIDWRKKWGQSQIFIVFKQPSAKTISKTITSLCKTIQGTRARSRVSEPNSAPSPQTVLNSKRLRPHQNLATTTIRSPGVDKLDGLDNNASVTARVARCREN